MYRRAGTAPPGVTVDVWDGNGARIEAELGLRPRRPWYWPFGGTRHGAYRGFRIVVAVSVGSEAGPPSTTFRVDLDAARIGPPGFRQVSRLLPRRAAAALGKRRFVADDPDQLPRWLRHHGRILRDMLEPSAGAHTTTWYVRRNWRRLTMDKWGLMALRWT